MLAKKIKFILTIFFIMVFISQVVMVIKIRAAGLVNINTASLEELDSLPGIGPSKAQAVIDYRTEHGQFETLEDLMNVSGIGQITFDGLKDFITLNEVDNIPSGEQKVIINELLPNPTGADDFEWIELKNIGETEIDVVGWQISDNSKTYIINKNDLAITSVAAGSFFILERAVTGIALNNSGGETVSLRDNSGKLISQTAYSETAAENKSWARQGDNSWQWCSTPTKNQENTNQPTEDGGTAASENEESQESAGAGSNSQTNSTTQSKKGNLIINEIMVDPLGLDDGFNEWLEIYNTSTQEVWLAGWKVKNKSGEYVFKGGVLQSGKFLVVRREQSGLKLNNLGDELILEDEWGKVVDQVAYKKIYENKSFNWCGTINKWLWLDETSAGGLNNCAGDAQQPVAYFEMSADQAATGQSIKIDASESYGLANKITKYIWSFEKEVEITNKRVKEWVDEKSWIEVKFLNVGQQRVTLMVVDEMGRESEYLQKIKIIKNEEKNINNNASNKSSSSNKSISSNRNFGVVDLLQIKSLSKGSWVTVEGQVAVEPGVLGANIFYLIDEKSGIQIYSYQKDFPDLILGDRIKVNGELSEVYGEKRIKTADKSAIEKIESDVAPNSREIGQEKLVDSQTEFLGALLKVSGEVLEVGKDYLWLDDGQEEVRVIIKPTTNIDVSSLELIPGDQVVVQGILSQTTAGLRLLPRYKDDIKIKMVLGEKNAGADGNKKNEPKGWLKYLLVVLVGGALGGGLLWWNKYQLKKNNSDTDAELP